jgi:hypothetical protein
MPSLFILGRELVLFWGSLCAYVGEERGTLFGGALPSLAGVQATDPANGVHKPANKSTAPTIPRRVSMRDLMGAAPPRPETTCSKSAVAATSRIKRRAAPGQPRAKDENSLRKMTSFQRRWVQRFKSRGFAERAEAQKGAV